MKSATSIRPLPPRRILGAWCVEPWELIGNGRPAVFMSRAGLDEWLARYGEDVEEAEQLEMDLAA